MRHQVLGLGLTEALAHRALHAHQFRAGSRIRLTIEAPGGDRPEWTFDTPATGGAVVNRILIDRTRPSRVVLPVLPSGPNLGAAPAPCPSIRSQPCRPFPAAGS